MRGIVIGFLGLFAAVGGCSMAAGDSASMPTAGGARAGEGPLVVELFTSQGCSSCPPADRLLAKLVADGKAGGRQVVPLSFHVDYWNDLGWADPFSLPAWTERQRQYSDALGDRSVYTPELVVGGAAGMVGSQEGRVMKAISEAVAPAALTASASWAKDKVVVTATAPADADVVVAVWETHTETDVLRGENSGEKLGSDHVVRRFERVAAAGATGSVTIPIDARWKDVGAVAFAQRRDKKIVGSALLPR